MDLELVSKLVTVAASVFALYKIIIETANSKKPHLREEFKFVKEFMAELTPETHPYIVEKGYHAITGDTTLGAQEIRYLLSLVSPGLALRRYSSARELLDFVVTPPEGTKPITFKKKYASQCKRKWLKRWYVGLYAVLASFAFLPIIFVKYILNTSGATGLVMVVMAFVAFGPLAVSSLFSYGRIKQAEEVVRQQ
jgi:hypothetical protein